jgi:hypothetical protein
MNAPMPENHAAREEALGNAQKQVLEMIASGAPLRETLTALAWLLEAPAPGMLASLLLLDEDCIHIRHVAAPSLPAEFVAAVDGQPIGPCAGSCGTAAYRKEPSSSKTLPPIRSGRNTRRSPCRMGCALAGPCPSLTKNGTCWARSRCITANPDCRNRTIGG